VQSSFDSYVHVFYVDARSLRLQCLTHLGISVESPVLGRVTISTDL
jgi:hypothetical protein